MSKTMLPSSRPKQTEEETRKALKAAGVDLTKTPVALLAVRGYYKDSMGVVGKNDRGIYDDAIMVVTPEGYLTVNANTDPSIFRQGIATLKPGLHLYRKGNHGISKPGGGYPAFRPATKNEELPVTRDGIANPSPGVAINIHRGSLTTTSSEGCQTIHPSQWAMFKEFVYKAMTLHKQSTLPYLLTVN